VAVSSAEVFDYQLGWIEAWGPTITGTSSPVFPGKTISAIGTGFSGFDLDEGSTGDSTTSATNYPLFQIYRLDNQQVRWLTPDPDHPFTETAFTAAAFSEFPFGHALLTAHVNGISNQSQVVLFRDFYRLRLPLVLRN
jgi:hypothetical protein